MSSSFTTRCTSSNDLTLSSNSQPIRSFFLQSSSPSLRPCQSLVSLRESDVVVPPVPPRHRPSSSRVADIIHRFESRASPRSIVIKQSTPKSKPQPIIVYERITNHERRIPPASENEPTTSSSSSSSSPKLVESVSHCSELSTRFSSSEINLVDQYRRLDTNEAAVKSETNLSKVLFDTNLPLKYKRDSLIRLYG